MLYFTTGATHVGSCPVQPNIPIYLIVMGSVSILALSMTYLRSIYKDGVIFVLSSAFMTFLHIFSFAWFIAGMRVKDKAKRQFLCDVSIVNYIASPCLSAPLRQCLGLSCLSSKLLTWHKSVLQQDNLPVCLYCHYSAVGRLESHLLLRWMFCSADLL